MSGDASVSIVADELHGDPGLVGIEFPLALCLDCQRVGPASSFPRVGGDFGTRMCPRCGSLNVVLECTEPPDLSACRVTAIVQLEDKEAVGRLCKRLNKLGLNVGPIDEEGNIAQVDAGTNEVSVTVPRVLAVAIIFVLTKSLKVRDESVSIQ